MAAVAIEINGLLYDKLRRTTQNVVLRGQASIIGLEIGGGPMPGGGGPVDPGYGVPETPVDPGYGVPERPRPGAPHPEHPIYLPPVDAHPEHPIVLPPSNLPEPPQSGTKPPPAGEGGWGYYDGRWGYFPGPGQAGPKA